jgi:hypothetical protein
MDYPGSCADTRPPHLTHLSPSLWRIGSAMLGFSANAESVATPQTARGWACPPCRHFKIQSCCCCFEACPKDHEPRTWLRAVGWWYLRRSLRRPALCTAGTLLHDTHTGASEPLLPTRGPSSELRRVGGVLRDGATCPGGYLYRCKPGRREVDIIPQQLSDLNVETVWRCASSR